MRTPKFITIAAVVAVAVGLGLSLNANAQSWKVGDTLPTFTGAAASDGKTHDLAKLAKDKPTVLYFIKASCPTNEQAVRFYQRVHTAYKGKVNLVGIIDGDKAAYESWNARHKVDFPVIFDPQKRLISQFKAQRSPWVLMVDSSGKVAKEWPGYSAPDVEALSNSIAAALGSAPIKVDTSGAPARSQGG